MRTKEDYINEYWEHIISDASYNYYDDFGEDYEEQINEWAESYANRRMKENKEMNDELNKYKRAFDVFKRLDGPGRALLIAAIFDIVTDEEYELLEELMKDA